MRVPLEITLKFVIADQFKVMFTPESGSDAFWVPFASGAISAAIRTLSLYPLDLARTRLAADSAPRGRHGLYRGVWDSLEIAYVREGLRGWYKGLGLSLAWGVPHFGLTFGVYEHVDTYLPNKREGAKLWWFPAAKISAAAASSVAATLALYPLDTLRRRAQVRGSLGFIDNARLMTGGWQSLWRGASLHVLRAGPAALLQFTLYDLVRSALLAQFPSASSTPL
ncbi:unnamed protein product [Pedinophyceae sp. YPF-701]|nr:unnamed protein product [Pedinophyceae sp. YPF-701]